MILGVGDIEDPLEQAHPLGPIERRAVEGAVGHSLGPVADRGLERAGEVGHDDAVVDGVGDEEPMARLIEVVVSPTGETTVQTKGYAGADCLQASRFLEQALGVTTADRKTAEYHQAAPAQQQVRQ